jgi:hypothetical protein
MDLKRIFVLLFIIIVGCITYLLWPFLPIIASLTYQHFILDGSKIHDSKYEGYTLTVSPSAKLGRLSNYGGSQDKYHYLMTDYTDSFPNISERLSDVKDIQRHTEFKVFRVERSKSGFNLDTLCILKDTSGLGLQFAEECSNLKR